MIYSVIIFKKDQDHITAVETDNYDESFKCWEALTEKWTNCLSEKKPFAIITPVVVAFDPGLIYQVAIVPIQQTTQVNSNNPYQQKMQSQGLTSTLRNNSSAILDGGFKY